MKNLKIITISIILVVIHQNSFSNSQENLNTDNKIISDSQKVSQQTKPDEKETFAEELTQIDQAQEAQKISIDPVTEKSEVKPDEEDFSTMTNYSEESVEDIIPQYELNLNNIFRIRHCQPIQVFLDKFNYKGSYESLKTMGKMKGSVFAKKYEVEFHNPNQKSVRKMIEELSIKNLLTTLFQKPIEEVVKNPVHLTFAEKSLTFFIENNQEIKEHPVLSKNQITFDCYKKDDIVIAVYDNVSELVNIQSVFLMNLGLRDRIRSYLHLLKQVKLYHDEGYVLGNVSILTLGFKDHDLKKLSVLYPNYLGREGENIDFFVTEPHLIPPEHIRRFSQNLIDLFFSKNTSYLGFYQKSIDIHNLGMTVLEIESNEFKMDSYIQKCSAKKFSEDCNEVVMKNHFEQLLKNSNKNDRGDYQKLSEILKKNIKANPKSRPTIDEVIKVLESILK